MSLVKELKQTPNQSAAKVEFRLKLLAGDNVLLAEANGYDTEIFVPQIAYGRITFQNVIPSRRCYCEPLAGNTKATKQEPQSSNSNSATTSEQKKSNLPKMKTLRSSNNWRLSAGQDSLVRLQPAAFSTPSSANTMNKETNFSPVHQCSPTNRSESMLTLPSPELARFAPVASSSLQLLRNKFVPVPNGMRVVKMYRDPTPGTPPSVGRVLGGSPLRTSNSYTRKTCTSPRIESSSYYLPCTPDLKAQGSSRNIVAQPPGTVTKWRKCITPARTYSRRTNNGTPKTTAKQVFSGKKPIRVVPTFLVNPTQGPKPIMKLEVRRRKLIVDKKRTISPKSFKKQQLDSCSLESSSSRKLPCKRKNYENSKFNVNDLIRNSNRGTAISAKLSQQFNKACFDRVCATYPKYKLLCAIPPLDSDMDSRVIRAKLKEQEQQTQTTTTPMSTTANASCSTANWTGTTQENQKENINMNTMTN